MAGDISRMAAIMLDLAFDISVPLGRVVEFDCVVSRPFPFISTSICVTFVTIFGHV